MKKTLLILLVLVVFILLAAGTIFPFFYDAPPTSETWTIDSSAGPWSAARNIGRSRNLDINAIEPMDAPAGCELQVAQRQIRRSAGVDLPCRFTISAEDAPLWSAPAFSPARVLTMTLTSGEALPMTLTLKLKGRAGDDKSQIITQTITTTRTLNVYREGGQLEFGRCEAEDGCILVIAE